MYSLKSMFAVATAAGFIVITGTSANAQASAKISFAQVGADVVATLSGNVSTSGGLPIATNSGLNGIDNSPDGIDFGAGQTNLFLFVGPNAMVFDPLSSPWTSFSNQFAADSHSGDILHIYAAQSFFGVQSGYSGGPMSGTMTFLGKTLGTLGLTAGNTSRWTYGAGGVNEFKIEATSGGGAVPEPGEWAAMGILGAGLTGLVIRKRRMA